MHPGSYGSGPVLLDVHSHDPSEPSLPMCPPGQPPVGFGVLHPPGRVSGQASLTKLSGHRGGPRCPRGVDRASAASTAIAGGIVYVSHASRLPEIARERQLCRCCNRLHCGAHEQGGSQQPRRPQHPPPPRIAFPRVISRALRCARVPQSAQPKCSDTNCFAHALHPARLGTLAAAQIGSRHLTPPSGEGARGWDGVSA